MVFYRLIILSASRQRGYLFHFIINSLGIGFVTAEVLVWFTRVVKRYYLIRN